MVSCGFWPNPACRGGSKRPRALRRPVLRLPVDASTELVLLEGRHADELYRLVDANRAHLAQWLPWAEKETPEDARQFIDASLVRYAEGDGGDLGIVHEGRLVGGIGLHYVDHVNGRTAIGYWLAAGSQGKGLATAACRALIDHCFRDLKLHRVELRIAPENARSLCVARRLGLREEGTLREYERLGERWLDLVVFSILDREWAPRPTAGSEDL